MFIALLADYRTITSFICFVLNSLSDPSYTVFPNLFVFTSYTLILRETANQLNVKKFTKAIYNANLVEARETNGKD